MNAHSKTRTLTASLLVALAMLVAVPTAFAAGKPDDEHRQLGSAMAVDVPTASAAGGGDTQGLPRAMPSDYAAAGVNLADSSQVPATSNHFGGIPRAMPSDYEVYFASISPAASDGFDWSDAALGAGASTARLLTIIAAGALAARRRSNPPSGVGASVVQH